MAERSFVERAESAMRGAAEEGVTLLSHGRPAVLDANGRKALIVPLVAAFFWAAAIFREGLTHPLDPLALLLRLFALSATLRGLLALRLLLGRLRELGRLRSYQLALCDEGLLLRTPTTDYALAKEDVIDIREHGAWQEHGARRWSDVYLITRPASGRLYLAVPPMFMHTPGVLAETLMRWRGVVAADPNAPERKPLELPSKLFDAIVAGERPDGVAVIEQGRGFLRRGPYATVLLGIAVLEGFLRTPPAVRGQLGLTTPIVAGLCLVLVPLLWLVLTRRSIAARKGIALVLAPAELLMRIPSGVLRVPYPDIARLEVKARTVWSILDGASQMRSLLIHRKSEGAINYAEAFLGVPAEVALALCDGYRKGVLP
jgi:hypothetical protein